MMKNMKSGCPMMKNMMKNMKPMMENMKPMMENMMKNMPKNNPMKGMFDMWKNNMKNC